MTRISLILIALLLGSGTALIADLRIVSTDASPYRVVVNGDTVSEHTTQHKAIQRAINALEADPSATVRVRRNLELRIERDADGTGDPDEPEGGGTDDSGSGDGETSGGDASAPDPSPPVASAEAPTPDDLRAQGYDVRTWGPAEWDANEELRSKWFKRDDDGEKPLAVFLEPGDYSGSINVATPDPDRPMIVAAVDPSNPPAMLDSKYFVAGGPHARFYNLSMGEIWCRGTEGSARGDLRFIGCTAGGGVEVRTSDVQFIQCRIFDGAQGLFAKEVSDIVVSECWFSGSGESASRDHGAYLAWTDGVTITDTVFQGAASAAIKLQAADNTTVRNCLFVGGTFVMSPNSNNKASAGDVTSDNFIFENNVCVGTQGAGAILGWSLADSRIKGNIFADFGGPWLQFRRAFQNPEDATPIRNVEISGNVVDRVQGVIVRTVNTLYTAENVTVSGNRFSRYGLAISGDARFRNGEPPGVTFQDNDWTAGFTNQVSLDANLTDRLRSEPIKDVVAEQIKRFRQAYGMGD